MAAASAANRPETELKKAGYLPAFFYFKLVQDGCPARQNSVTMMSVHSIPAFVTNATHVDHTRPELPTTSEIGFVISPDVEQLPLSAHSPQAVAL
ncbi:hypothetical protein [Rhizobium sullae]|uniref:Uncharacterized protein n=1 Tax=Rhizobium sullae TaxID=50338 RepID=A0A4R3Q6V9_RHISU|nr:hypothetical protein [Rhizobium sullae]TCU17050.1 hypothetical protein EV132_10473 [Rhizobium sullae]